MQLVVYIEYFIVITIYLIFLYILVCSNHVLIWSEFSSTNTSDLVQMLQDVCL